MPNSIHLLPTSSAPPNSVSDLVGPIASDPAFPMMDVDTLRRALDYAQSIVANVRWPLVVLDATLRVKTASRAFYKHFRVAPAETEGRYFYDLGNRQWNIAALRTLLEEVLPQDQSVEDYEVRHTFEQLGPRVMQITAHRLAEAPDDEPLIILSIDDITERRLGEALMQQAAEAARATEARYRDLFDLSPVAVYSCDASGVIEKFNRHAAQLWGREPALGDTDELFCGSFKMFRPDGTFMPHDQCPMADVLSSKIDGVHDGQVLIHRPDGSRIAVIVNIRPLKNERGEVIGAINCFYDITERTQGEEARARLAALVESSDDAIIGKDLDGIITSWNGGAERLFGYTAQEIVGQSIVLLVPPERLSEEADILGQIRKGEPVEQFETVRRRKDGTLIDVSLTTSPIVGAAGKIVGASKIARDITASKRAAETLRASEERYRSIIDSSPDCIKVLDLQGNLLALEAGLELLGIADITPLLGQSWIEFWSRDHDREAARAAVAAAASGGEGHFVGSFRTFQGLDKWWDVAVSPVRDAFGQPARLLAVSRDVTERHEMERMLAARAAELVQADHSKDEFLAMLAHELRNPLAPLRNAAEILQDPEVTDDERAQAQRIIGRQLENMSRMIDDLLDVSRITEGKIELRKKPVSLEAILTAATSLARAGCVARGQDLALSMPAEPVFLNADATRLEQVFGNLLTNASKYGGDCCHITLRAERTAGEILVSVADDGAGIAPELLPRVFDLFVQSSRTLDRAHGGLGIGLTLVQRLVKLHGGSVEARSEGLGKGAEFVVRLPILTEAPPLPPLPLPPAARGLSRRILVVDDNTDSARTMAALQTRRGHATRTAFNGLEALSAAAEFQPEVVLLDIGLPGMDGFEVARKIRGMAAPAGPLLIATTGYASEEDRAQCLAAGFDEHLVKPIDLGLLREWLANHPRLAPAS